MRTPVSWFLLLALAVPIFGHGCHRWDHDDEPLIVPVNSRYTESEPPR